MEASKKYADDNGLELVEQIEDIGVSAYSGKNISEGAFSQFLAAIEAGEVEKDSVLIVESLDRLSRQEPFLAQQQLSNIINAGIEVVTLIDGQRYSREILKAEPFKFLMSYVAMVRANEESETKSKRVKSAWAEKRKVSSNIKLTKKCPAWLTLAADRKSFIIDEPKADAVRKIYELSVGGMGIYSITRFMNDNFEPIAQSKVWNSSYVTKILRNEAVIGIFRPNNKVNGKRIPTGEIWHDYYPPIIDETTFHLAQSRKDSRKSNGGRKGKVISNLFSRIAICGKCGGTMMFKNKGKPPKGYTYLRCHASVTSSACDCPAWRYDEFEKSFLEFVSDISFGHIFSKSGAGEVETVKDQIEAKQAELRTHTNGFYNIVETFERGNLPDMMLDTLTKRSSVLAEEIQSAEREISELEMRLVEITQSNQQADQDTLVGLSRMLSEIGEEDRRLARSEMADIIKRNIASISVYNGHKAYPWEWDILPSKFINEVKSKGYFSSEDIEGYLESVSGKRHYNEFSRYYEVVFTNDTKRIVWPHDNATYHSDENVFGFMKQTLQ